MKETQGYSHEGKLVETEWLHQHREDDNLRIVESNEDILLYDTGHIAGAVHIDWRRDLQNDQIRDQASPEQFAAVCATNGITPETTVVFYGDKSNWWACYALWVFELNGHTKVKLLNGGRDKWASEGREFTRQVSHYPTALYPVPPRRRDVEIRAFFPEVLAFSRAERPLLDVRSPGEFSGQVTHMPEYPQEGVLRGGHVPRAQNIPWKSSVREDGTFKSREELAEIYEAGAGLSSAVEAIVYCRIGERSSHTWFVLKYLLGHTAIRNYDGSWCEWGNMIRAPIELAG